jgi:hypothetical protein
MYYAPVFFYSIMWMYDCYRKLVYVLRSCFPLFYYVAVGLLQEISVFLRSCFLIDIFSFNKA